MKKIRLLNLRISTLLLRYYLMMATVIALGMLQQWTLAAIGGISIAVLAILGVSYTAEEENVAQHKRLEPRREQPTLRKAG
jgi:hypothetical protein